MQQDIGFAIPRFLSRELVGLSSALAGTLLMSSVFMDEIYLGRNDFISSKIFTRSVNYVRLINTEMLFLSLYFFILANK